MCVYIYTYIYIYVCIYIYRYTSISLSLSLSLSLYIYIYILIPYDYISCYYISMFFDLFKKAPVPVVLPPCLRFSVTGPQVSSD